MKKRVTLTVEEDYILAAKEYGKMKGKTVSQLVERYFDVMGQPPETRPYEELSPIVRRLTGSLKGTLKGDGLKNYREAYDDYLEEKYP